MMSAATMRICGHHKHQGNDEGPLRETQRALKHRGGLFAHANRGGSGHPSTKRPLRAAPRRAGYSSAAPLRSGTKNIVTNATA